MIKQAFDWLVKSSQDPAKLSLTIKSIAAFAVLFGIDNTVIDEGANTVVTLIVALGMVASAGSGVYGFLRKFKK